MAVINTTPSVPLPRGVATMRPRITRTGPRGRQPGSGPGQETWRPASAGPVETSAAKRTSNTMTGPYPEVERHLNAGRLVGRISPRQPHDTQGTRPTLQLHQRAIEDVDDLGTDGGGLRVATNRRRGISSAERVEQACARRAMTG